MLKANSRFSRNHGFWIVSIFVILTIVMTSCGNVTKTAEATPLPVATAGGGPNPTNQVTPTLPAATEPAPTIPAPSLANTGANYPVAVGILAVVPGSSGSNVDPKAVAAVVSSDVKYMRISLEWSISEPNQGQVSYDTKNDKDIQRVEQAGLKVFPTLYVGSGWMNGKLPSRRQGQNQAQGSRSYPPSDLSQQWNDQYGYSQTYYNFLTQFFSHYKGHFDFVAIENEANSQLFWGGTADEYVRLIKTAYKAIKAADPHVKIVDSGFVSNILGACIAQDELQNGTKTKDEVVQYAELYYNGDTDQIKINSAADLDNTLANATVQEQCQRINTMIDNMGGSIDDINFHYYQDYRALPGVVDWLKIRTQRAGYTVGVVTNEIGFRGTSAGFADSPDLARQVFMKEVTALSVGLDAVVWFSADTVASGKDKVGFFGPGGSLRVAGQTFKMVIETLYSGYQIKQIATFGPSIYHFIFQDSQGVASLEALWSDGSLQTLQLTAPPGSSRAVVTDYSGQNQIYTVKDGSISLQFNDAPVFVNWK